MELKLKRAYEEPSADDGYRILVDRVWPRGLTKQQLAVDLWLRGIAPSTDLRKWFGHDPSRWEEFRHRYQEELAEKQDLLAEILQRAKQGPVTLVYGAKDEARNQAVVIKEIVEKGRHKG